VAYVPITSRHFVRFRRPYNSLQVLADDASPRGTIVHAIPTAAKQTKKIKPKRRCEFVSGLRIVKAWATPGLARLFSDSYYFIILLYE